MNDSTMISGIVVLLMATTYVLYPRFEKAASAYHHQWIPFTGGVAIGYVFLYLLPKLSDYTNSIRVDGVQGVWEILDYRVYIYGLAGFTFYYFVDQYRSHKEKDHLKPEILHGGGFFIYSMLCGYILANWSRPGLIPVLLAGSILTLHMLAVNYQVRKWNSRVFDNYFRWMFALALIIGWSVGAFLAIPKELEIIITGILAGGIITNIMNEELPDQEPHKIRPFIAGVVLILIVTVFMRSLPKFVV